MKILPIVAIAFAMSVSSAAGAFAHGQVAPSADPNAAQNPAVKSPNNRQSAPLAKGHNSFTKGEARSRIRKAGYTNVTSLMKNSEGLWQGQAMKDGRMVGVSLDYKGDVAAS